ncbi:hypothetical protein AKJ09_08704 [Labilithrix luteola]|uniref:Lipoprotein n=1 Tax=Labilithrix luteola TaxID=1391654 RepID=A0A0K1Q8A3_9BACT|nr:hypothetical protein [Labilithrix luteola]AKV02041.1 hypothetical protein AKJ09_08704 [Labilithrix luteola]
MKPNFSKVVVTLIAGSSLSLALWFGAGCGGEVSIGQGRSSLLADGGQGAVVDDPAGHCDDGGCAPPQPGDCSMAKCANMQTACIDGVMEHLRCVPSPYRGQGSAPADQCDLIGDCTNERLATKPPCPEAECGARPTSCAYGTPNVIGCVVDYEATKDSARICAWNYRCE